MVTNNITSLYFAEDWVDSWYDHANNLIVTTWFNLSTSVHYRKLYLTSLSAAQKFRPKAVIIDTSKAFGVPYPEDHRWLIKTVFPQVEKLQLEFIINVFPKNFIAKSGVKSIIDYGKKCNFNIIDMPSFELAYDFIKSH